jgi:probable phosphomutase (TIGR03848 family)
MNQMTLLLLIRHAENDARKTRLVGRMPGIHLNEQGREQAEKLATRLAKEPIQAIYASPLERAVETAQPLANALNLPVKLTPAVIEIDYGQWQGRTYKQLKRAKLWQEVGKDPSKIRFPGGETFLEAQQRAVTALEDLATDSDMIAVFTHADIILLTLAHFLNMPLNDFYRLEIKPASLSVVELKDGKARILHVNQVLDLELPHDKPEE